MNKKIISSLSILSIFLMVNFYLGCSGSDSDSSSSPSVNSTTYPSGLAFASLTQGSSAASLNFQNVNLLAISSNDTYEEKKAKIDEVANSTDATKCIVTLPNFTGSVNNPNCYGPNLIYANHPNASSSVDDDYVDGGGGSDDYSLPSQDLGIWSSVQGSESCASSKINQLTQNIALKVDAAQMAVAAAKCLMNVNGVSEPGIGESRDLTSSLNSALSANNSGLTVTNAIFSREANSGDDPVYKYELTISYSSQTILFGMRHSQNSTDSSVYNGRIFGRLDLSPKGTAFSLNYSKSGSDIKYHLVSGEYTSGTDQLLNNGSFNLNSTGWDSNFNQTIANFNETSKTGALSYSWQAGQGDSHSRVFNAYVVGGSTGCAFFGYGSKFDKTISILPNNSISTFICNWAGPGNSHTGLSGKAQKQCFAVGGAVSSEAITYAPVNSCDKSSNQEGTSSGTDYFRYSTTTPSNVTTAGDWDVNESHTITNDLITLSSDTEFGNYTSPTAPSISF